MNSTTRAHGRLRPAPIVAAALLLAILTPSVLYPLARVAVEIAQGAASADAWAGPAVGAVAGAFVRSLGVALLIAAMATALAFPAARLLARRGAIWAPMLMTPMLMPAYLAYAGWGLARAPGTILGDALERAASAGARWAPIYTGRSLAIVALALWAFPLAALVLASSIARRDPALDDVLRLEPASKLLRIRAALGLHRASIGASVALVALAMLGSSVPLHLAQVDTLAIVVWRELSESPRADWWQAWVSASPLLALAMLGAWIVGGRLVRAGMSDSSELPRDDTVRRVGLWTRASAVAVWIAAVGAPIALFAISIRSPDSLWRFWRLSAEGVRTSLLTALAVSLCSLLIALSLSYLLSTRSRGGARVASGAVRVLLLSAMAPGVLVGAALVESFPSLEPRALPVLAGVARFGFVAAVGACLASWAEPLARRDARLLASPGARAWAIACLPTQWALLVGASLAAGLMSLHEIEASVLVQPPGSGALAQQILSYLHFARLEDMSSAGLWLVGGGTLAALGVTGLIALGARAGQGRAGGRS